MESIQATPAITTEEIQAATISVCQVRKIVPGNPGPWSVIRWMTKGFSAANGERIKLRYVKFGSRRYTSEAWIAEFCATLVAREARPPIERTGYKTVRRPSARQRQRQIEDAKRELARA